MRFDFNQLEFFDTDINPEKLAVSGSDLDISWKNLKEKTDELCSLFHSLGIPKGHPIIIYGHKEYLFPVAILASIKCGIPYIPCDRLMPDDRIRKIQKTSGSQVIICSGDDFPQINFAIRIDNQLRIFKNNAPVFEGNTFSFPNETLCYIMFTSGSTGEPKGVMISLESVRSFIRWLVKIFPVSEKTVFMNQAVFSFDISLIDVLGTFYLGATMVLIDSANAKRPLEFLARIKKYNCTLWNSTPSFVFMYLSEPLFSIANLNSFETFLFLGEDLPARTVRRINENFPGKKVCNAYGPTEATVATTYIEITNSILIANEKSLPIGYPKDDGEIVINNESNNPFDQGELIVVGDHVSLGYLNRPDLTDEKFYLLEGKRAYRTGDFGYFKDGIIFFDGRKDDQVKLHGYRIEIGEITEMILRQKNVIDAITIPLRSGGQVKRIVSFAKLKSDDLDKELERKNILEALSKSLPSYMIPSDLCFVKEFPTNTNHKIDRNKLIEWYSNR